MERLDAKKIRTFLSKLTDVEFRYLRIQESMANDARNLIQEFNLSKEQFCDLMEIKETEYTSYLNGGFNYDIMKMALSNSAYCKLHAERANKEVQEKHVNIAKI